MWFSKIGWVVVLFCCTSSQAEDFHTWKDTSGKFSREARFVEFDAASQSVCLTTKDGHSIKVPYAKLNSEDQAYAREVDGERQDSPTIGVLDLIVLGPAVIQLFKKKNLPLPKHRNGLLLRNVPRGCPAWVAGLRSAELIYAVDNNPVKTIEDLFWVLKAMQIGHSYEFHVEERPDDSKHYEDKVFKVVPLRRSEVLAAVKNAPPLVLGGFIEDNSIGVPVAKLVGKNESEKAIVAFVVALHCFDRFGKPVGGFGGLKSNKVSGISQETVRPGAKLGILEVTLNGHETATVVKIYLTHVKFDDGSEWKNDDGVFMYTAESHK